MEEETAEEITLQQLLNTAVRSGNSYNPMSCIAQLARIMKASDRRIKDLEARLAKLESAAQDDGK